MKNLNRVEEPAETRFEAHDPDDCKTMLDVRAGVDEIDRMLVAQCEHESLTLVTRDRKILDQAPVATIQA